MGTYGIWDNVIPSSMKSPTEDIPMLGKKSNGLLLFDEEEEDNSVSGSLSDLGENSNGEFQLPISRKNCANIHLAKKIWMRMKKNMELIYFQRLSLTRKGTGWTRKIWIMAMWDLEAQWQHLGQKCRRHFNQEPLQCSLEKGASYATICLEV